VITILTLYSRVFAFVSEDLFFIGVNSSSTFLHGLIYSVTCLLAVISDVNVPNSQGWTALMFASRNGHLSAVRTLLDNG